jgi:hypothetical protein
MDTPTLVALWAAWILKPVEVDWLDDVEAELQARGWSTRDAQGRRARAVKHPGADG